MTTGAGRTIWWDAENRPISITLAGITTTFTYDGDGKRVKKAETNGSAITTTIYVGSYYEETTAGAVTETVKYYYAGAKRIAMRRAGTLTYLFSDHLGSTSVTLNATTGATNTIQFFPFGGTRAGSVPTDYAFTGQRLDGYVNMTWMADHARGKRQFSGLIEPLRPLEINASSAGRFYDHSLARFAQPDSVVPDMYNPQSLNRYSYAYNSPLKYVDVSGHFAIPAPLVAAYFIPAVGQTLIVATVAAVAFAGIAYLGYEGYQYLRNPPSIATTGDPSTMYNQDVHGTIFESRNSGYIPVIGNHVAKLTDVASVGGFPANPKDPNKKPDYSPDSANHYARELRAALNNLSGEMKKGQTLRDYLVRNQETTGMKLEEIDEMMASLQDLAAGMKEGIYVDVNQTVAEDLVRTLARMGVNPSW